MKTRWDEDYGAHYEEYLQTILSHQPDFIVPVGRKSAKLFQSLDKPILDRRRVHYRDYFEMFPQDLRRSQIAIVDDAVKTTSTLLDYRNFFVARGAEDKNIRTYAFLGHSCLRSRTKRYDQQAEISGFLPEASYLQYLLYQSGHLIVKGVQADIDHLVLEMDVPAVSSEMMQRLWKFLEIWGYVYRLDPIGNNRIQRVGFCSDYFDPLLPELDSPNISLRRDFVNKIRFIYMAEQSRLAIIPMVFPLIKVEEGAPCVLKDQLPFWCEPGAGNELSSKSCSKIEVACTHRKEHPFDKYCYLSICLWLSSLLAKRFLEWIGTEVPEWRGCFQNLSVRSSNLASCLGPELAANVAESIGAFLANLDYRPEVGTGKPQSYWIESPFPFSCASIPSVISHLRQGYEDAVQRNNGSRVGVTYTQPVNELLRIDQGTHPLIFTEMLDELCDFGVMVPETRLDTTLGAWQRVYRTGEGPHDDTAWERSKRILWLAIHELGASNIYPMYLMKVMANFVCDFSPAIDQSMFMFPENHSFSSIPADLGAVVQALHPASKQFVRLYYDGHIRYNEQPEIWEDLVEFVVFDEKTFSCADCPEDIHKYLESGRFYRDYFSFLGSLKNSFNNIQALNTLALCRNWDLFYSHLMYNIYRWTRKGSLLTFLKDEGPKSLNFSGTMASSAKQKLECVESLSGVLEACSTIASTDPLRYKDVWERIQSNVSFESDHETLQQAQAVVAAMKVLDAMVKSKVQRKGAAKRTRTVLSLGPTALADIGVPEFDIASFVHNNDVNISETIIPLYQRVVEVIGRLPKPKDVRDIYANMQQRESERSSRKEQRQYTVAENAVATHGYKGAQLDETQYLPNGEVCYTFKEAMGSRVSVLVDSDCKVSHIKLRRES